MTSTISAEAISPLRRRMIEDMSVRKFGEKTRNDYIRHVEAFAATIPPCDICFVAKVAFNPRPHVDPNRGCHRFAGIANAIWIVRHPQIPIERAAARTISGGFLPWRLSDDGPGASRAISMGPSSETLHNSSLIRISESCARILPHRLESGRPKNLNASRLRPTSRMCMVRWEPAAEKPPA